jgi:hypothetical protein
MTGKGAPPVASAGWYIWRTPGLTANERLVLLALAAFVGSDRTCWPAVGTVAGMCGLSERSVRRIISDLQRAGHLQVVGHVAYRRGGSTNRYKMHFADRDPLSLVTGGEPRPPVTGDLDPLSLVTEPPVTGDRETTKELPEEPTTTTDRQNATRTVHDERVVVAVGIYASAVRAKRSITDIRDPLSFEQTVHARTLADHGPALEAHLVQHPDATAEDLAEHVLKVDRWERARLRSGEQAVADRLAAARAREAQEAAVCPVAARPGVEGTSAATDGLRVHEATQELGA